MNKNHLHPPLIFLSVFLISSTTNTTYHCILVIDGGLFIAKDQYGELKEAVLLGVKVPPLLANNGMISLYGKKAADFTRGLIEGKALRLEFDKTMRDKEGKLLAYVYLPDGSFVNA